MTLERESARLEDPGAKLLDSISAHWARYGRMSLIGLGVIAVIAMGAFFVLRARAADEEQAAGKLAEANLYFWQGAYDRSLPVARQVAEHTNKTAYVGRTKSPSDFKDTDRDGKRDFAEKDFIVTKTIKKDGTVSYAASSKILITGSQLEVVRPDYMLWEDTTEVYPFLFTSDSDWSVDVCLYVPEGYQIAEGNCTQAFVSNETKEVLFTVVETGSPEPDATFDLAATHEGVTKTISVQIPGQRINRPFDWMTLLPIALFVIVAVVAVGFLAMRMKKQ